MCLNVCTKGNYRYCFTFSSTFHFQLVFMCFNCFWQTKWMKSRRDVFHASPTGRKEYIQVTFIILQNNMKCIQHVFNYVFELLLFSSLQSLKLNWYTFYDFILIWRSKSIILYRKACITHSFSSKNVSSILEIKRMAVAQKWITHDFSSSLSLT